MPLTTAPPEPFTTNNLGRRAGATWVAATGAALVLVAAAVLVASQWDRLSDVFKLGLLAGATGFCTWGGHRLRTTLPATGSVVFHLGVLLVPANLAALAVHLGASLGQHLLAQGVVGWFLFSATAAATCSVVLRWASVSSVPLVAAGVGALTPIPALGVLVAFAALAEWWLPLKARNAVVAWAGVAGLAPAFVAGLLVVMPGDAGAEIVSVVGVDGLTGTWISGLGAAAVLAWRAQRDADVALAALSIVSGVLAGVVGFSSTNLDAQDRLFGVASAFVLVQTLAAVAKRDPFWARPFAAFASICEVPAWIVGTISGAFLLTLGSVNVEALALEQDLTVAATSLVAGAGWLLAGYRRSTPSGYANVALAVVTTAGVVFATVDPTAAGLTVAAFAAAFAFAQRPPLLFSLAAAPMAIGFTAQDHPSLAMGVGLALAAAMTWQAITQTQQATVAGRVSGLALAASAGGVAFLAIDMGVASAFVATIASVAVIATLAAAAEMGSHELANVCRGWFVVSLASLDTDPRHVFLVSAAITASLIVDGLRLQRPWLVGIGAGVAQFAIAGACRDSGLSLPEAGIALAFYAVVLTGVAATVEAMWQRPLVAAAAVAGWLSLVTAGGDAQALAIVLVVLGSLSVAAGLALQQEAVAAVGGIAMVVGAIAQLHIANVVGVEFYVAPVSLYLAAVGEVVSRRRPISSWWSTAPGPALFAGVALLERLDGGAAVHALAAAVAAGGAVALGGVRRQAGPLLSGTAILAVLAANESLAALAGVPAWGWIGIVGASLIAIAVMIERSDTSPVQVGRRLVDVISETFD